MRTVNFSYTRKNLSSVMNIVVNNHSPLIITRQNHEPVVMISLEDFKSYEETAYLMQSEKNAKRLNSAIQQLENNRGNERELID